MGSSEITNEFRKRLAFALECRFSFFNKANNDKLAMFQAKVRECYRNAKELGLELYENEINKIVAVNMFMEQNEFEELHKKHLDAALNFFHSHQMEGGDLKTFKQIEEDLKAIIEKHYLNSRKINGDHRDIAKQAEEGFYFKLMNECKELYSAKMNEILLSQCRYIVNFDGFHKSAKKSALDKVSGATLYFL